jgi:uncharacterized protein with GYD domain
MDKGLGGTLEAFYYAFGDIDAFGIADMPDNISATAFSIYSQHCRRSQG